MTIMTGTKMIDQAATSTISMLKWTVGVYVTSALTILNENTGAISAVCTIICTVVVILRFRDSKKHDNKDTPD